MFTCEEDRQKHLTATTKLVDAFDDEIMPTLFADLDGNPSVIILPLPDDETKDEAKYFLMDLIRKNRITGFCFVCESYMTRMKETNEDVTLDAIMKMTPTERPDTKEIIMAQFCTAKETLFYIADIVKFEDGKRTLGKWECMKDWNVSGRFGQVWSDAISICN